MNAPIYEPVFAAPFQILDLAGAAPVAKGSERHVYQHPQDPSLLIKVIIHPKVKDGKIPRERANKVFHREDVYTVFQSELVEYVAVESQARPGEDATPLARIAGFARTSLGLGLVVEKIVDQQGRLAPTLKQVVARNGFDDALQERLRRFFCVLAENHVIFNDVGASNIVCGRNALGRQGMFLVDGFGPKQLVPVYAWSKALNRRRLMRKYPEIVQELRRTAGAGQEPPESMTPSQA